MRRLLAFLIAVTVLIGFAAPTQAATVIFYSKVDNSYGWCAGYSYGRGESCAREQCLSYGTKCELAIECDGGWSATAFANDPWDGFGASCEWQNSNAARSIAMVSCIYASHALCTISEAFNRSGNGTSAKSNAAFDTGWYAQTLLSTLGYDIGEVDGDIGSRTKAAIKQFQAAIRVEQTGEADAALIQKLLFNTGGTAAFVNRTIAETDAVDQSIVANYSYRYAGKPAQDVGAAAELTTLSDADRLAVLASIVNFGNAQCSSATSAAPQAGSPDTWAVACLEKTYTLTFGNGSPVIRVADVTIDCPPAPGPGPGPGPGPNDDNTAVIHHAGDGDTLPDDEQSKPSPVTIGAPMPGGPEPEAADAPPSVVCSTSADTTSSEQEDKPGLVTIGAPPPPSN